MKTPWSGLLKHGVAITTILVGSVAALIVLGIIGLAVLVAKISVLIK